MFFQERTEGDRFAVMDLKIIGDQENAFIGQIGFFRTFFKGGNHRFLRELDGEPVQSVRHARTLQTGETVFDPQESIVE